MAAVDTLKSDEATAQEEEERKGIISRVMNLDVKVDKGGTRATVVLPGLSYDDFDRTGNTGVWKISVLMISCRGAVSASPQSGKKMLGHSRPSNIAVFTVGSEMTISPTFYQKVAASGLSLPLEVTEELTGIGEKSYTYDVNLLDTVTGEALIKEVATFVFVDGKTKRPQPLPEQFKKKAVQMNVKGPSAKYPKLSLPVDKFFKYKMTASHSDTDRNRHVNRAVYFRYFIDTGTLASMKGFYTYFYGDLAEYRVKHATILYRGEVKPGTDFDIFTWEDSADKLKLYFKIMRESSHITDCVMEFCERNLSKL